MADLRRVRVQMERLRTFRLAGHPLRRGVEDDTTAVPALIPFPEGLGIVSRATRFVLAERYIGRRGSSFAYTLGAGGVVTDLFSREHACAQSGAGGRVARLCVLWGRVCAVRVLGMVLGRFMSCQFVGTRRIVNSMKLTLNMISDSLCQWRAFVL